MLEWSAKHLLICYILFQSDLWTAGAIAYEIFGGLNPFYSNQNSPGLLSTNYTMVRACVGVCVYICVFEFV